MTQRQEEVSKAFNEGCDARLAGLPAICPDYWYGHEMTYWRHGWKHVDLCWAKDVRLDTFAVRPLPRVKEVA